MKLSSRIPMVMLATSFLLAAPGAVEAQLAPPAGPNDAASARYTLRDIWSRLATGAAGVKRGASFVEPAEGPTTATNRTTDEIMAAAPAADDVNGATAADVAAGKTFWGLRTSGAPWGLTTGTAYPAPVEKTGQTQCYKYDGSSWVLDDGCATNTPASQDGKIRKGVAWPNPRFTKNLNGGGTPDGTVTDNLTGLVWLENANCFGSQTWVNAMNSANTLASGACGLTDDSTAGQWRLPNVKELQSLIDFAHYTPALSDTAGTGHWTEGDPFANVQSSYWSSTSIAHYPAGAWIVFADYGLVQNAVKAEAKYTWPVRSGR